MAQRGNRTRHRGWPETKNQKNFLSYCQKDKDTADLIEERLTPLMKDEFKISRDIRM